MSQNNQGPPDGTNPNPNPNNTPPQGDQTD